jgi:RimJ/RimL family protein N-acetyltransferase
MLQDIPTPILREPSPCVLETERLMLRRPTLADVKAIARLANDRRIAENIRRLPHPYSHDHAIEFVRATAADDRSTVFLIEHNYTPIGMVGVDWREPDAPELGYWLGVEHWGQGFGTEAARAVIDFTFEEFDLEHLISGARVSNPTSRNILEKCGFQWSGVELHRFEALGSSTPVDCFRLSRSVWSSLKNWGSSTRRER